MELEQEALEQGVVGGGGELVGSVTGEVLVGVGGGEPVLGVRAEFGQDGFRGGGVPVHERGLIVHHAACAGNANRLRRGAWGVIVAGMRILFFAQLREVCGVAEAELAVDGVEAAGLWEMLVARWPGLAAQRVSVRLARNGVYAGEGEIFLEGDEVALIPPVSGG